MPDVVATDETFTVEIPKELAAKFVNEESWVAPGRRGYALLRLGTTDLGYWRIEGIETADDMGRAHIVATLRKVLL